MKIEIRNWTIGPHHDPYGAQALTVLTTAGKEVCLYTDGLGRVQVIVNGEVAAESTSGRNEDDQKLLDLFEEECGLTQDQALKYYDRVHRNDIPDPYWSPAMYI